MKRLILLLIIALSVGMASSAATAANENLEDIFTEFSTEKNAEFVNVNPFMMWLGKQFVGNDPDAAIVKKIKSVRVLDLDECSSSTKAKFKERVARLSLKGYDELVRTNSEGQNVTVFAKMGKDKETIHQMIVVCAGAEDCVLVELNGKFKLSDVSGVVDRQTTKRNGRS